MGGFEKYQSSMLLLGFVVLAMHSVSCVSVKEFEDCVGEVGEDAAQGRCDTTNAQVVDCAGAPGGSALEDKCGVCDSDASNDCVSDCSGELIDSLQWFSAGTSVALAVTD